MSPLYSTESHIVIELSGKDTLDFLQRTTSQDLRNLEENEVRAGAFLTATGGVISTFFIGRENGLYLMAVQKDSVEKALQQIEKLHFGEDLKCQVSSPFGAIEVVRGTTRFAKRFTGQGYEVAIALKKEIAEYTGAKKVDFDGWKQHKVLAFQPLDQADLTESNIILEAGLEDFVHRNKGCYPGQEVIERIYTYGNIPRKFVQLESPVSIGFGDIFYEGLKSGRVTSVAKTSTYVANGYLLRAKSRIGQEVEVRGPEGTSNLAKITKVSPDLNKDAPA